MSSDQAKGGGRSGERKRARKILLCATGAYVTYGLPRIILQMIRHVADDVQVVLSRTAAKMVSPYAVEVASRNKVFVEMDDSGGGIHVPHIELSRNVDFIVVFPATVNIMGKVANGIADELVSTLILAADVPVIFMPVSNDAMIDHPAVQRNIRTLEADGYIVLSRVPGPEVATREGMELMGEGFPLPTLLVQMKAILSDPGSRARVHRVARPE
jgi:phosphopantothenoylcysteine decarboxylase